MHVDVYEGPSSPGPYLLVRRDTGRVSAPQDVRERFVPGRLVMRMRMISTDVIAGLNVAEAIDAISREKYYVARDAIDFSPVPVRRTPFV